MAVRRAVEPMVLATNWTTVSAAMFMGIAAIDVNVDSSIWLIWVFVIWIPMIWITIVWIMLWWSVISVIIVVVVMITVATHQKHTSSNDECDGCCDYGFHVYLHGYIWYIRLLLKETLQCQRNGEKTDET